MRRTKAAAIALLAALLLLPAGCRKKETQAAGVAEAPALPVKVIQVQSAPFSLTVPVTGTLVSNTRVDVKAETIGRIVKFPKQEGDAVAPGEAVAWVDQENYQLSVRQAETAVQVAEASLAKTRVMAAHNKHRTGSGAEPDQVGRHDRQGPAIGGGDRSRRAGAGGCWPRRNWRRRGRHWRSRESISVTRPSWRRSGASLKGSS